MVINIYFPIGENISPWKILASSSFSPGKTGNVQVVDFSRGEDWLYSKPSPDKTGYIVDSHLGEG